ncbi:MULTISPECIES: DUF805 domain-containing protein [Vibrio]|uniref:DUF805 domain-containing protein n=2 Tax=Vibrio TaxID=662 RepID=A0A7X4LML5_9VIBR|nr:MULTISPECIES: DUF805 domain-containing protein [Vibrio]MBF9000163.1 DUF805 domain-containing protein [Vibrio nitrifigilis]MZI94407.1 DUF805 domain-containing protein [Vibrio eleionomae]
MYYYLSAIRQYVNFRGRERRKAFWHFYLINIIIGFIFAALDGLFGTINAIEGSGTISAIYGAFIFLPSLALFVRRIHDTGRSGWWALLLFIPIIGFLSALYFSIADGHPYENEYGPSPKHLSFGR